MHMRRLSYLVLLFCLSLFASCTCISAKVENKTDQPIFVNEVGHLDGRIYEGYGELVMPGGNVSVPVYGELDIRARDMQGNTIFYATAASGEDSDFQVTSLEPDTDAPPLAAPYVGALGYDSPWSLLTCLDGEKVTIPEYGLFATVRNRSEKTLVLWVDSYPGETIHNWKEGFLAPPNGSVQLFANVVLEPYLRAFDPEGRLVYVEQLMRTERPLVEIPETLPEHPPVRPDSPYNNDCL